MAGITLFGVGLAVALEPYRTESTSRTFLTILYYASLEFLPRLARVLIFGASGAGLVAYGILRLNRSLLQPFMRPGYTIVDERVL
jgi:hypothetical protein